MNIFAAGIVAGCMVVGVIFFVLGDKPKLFILTVGGLIAAMLLITFMAWYIPNPWIRHEIAIDGKGYYLFCLPEAIAPPGNLPNEMFPEIGDWCKR